MSTNEVEGEPAIHRAARLGDLQALELLIVEGVPIDTRFDVETETDYYSQLQQLTPLMTAARSTDGATAETLAWLLEHGADLHAISKGGGTAAWYAAGKGGHWEWGPWQLMPGHAERLRFLLDAGLDPFETSFTGQSLIAEACYAGDPVAIQLLLDRGVSCEPVAGWEDRKGHFASPRPKGEFYGDQIPLFGAVESGSLECVQLLLAQGARIDRIDEHKNDVLDIALNDEDTYSRERTKGRAGNYEIASLLLEAGVPLERDRGDGQTRLYWMAFTQQERSVAFLLQRGASLAPDNRGCTPLYAICWHAKFPPIPAQESIIRMLIAAGIPIGLEELGAAIGGDVSNSESLRILLEAGADIHAANERGNTPLHWAVDQPCLECVELLLSYGANPLVPNRKGITPVDVARGNIERWSSATSKPEGTGWKKRYADESQAILIRLESVP